MTDTEAPMLNTDTLRGDVRDQLLAEFKHLPKPWQAMNEEEQDRLIRRASDIADQLVRSAVDLIAARGLPALPIEVGKITVDAAACKGTFECYADDENLLRIRHLQGSRAMFVLASPSAFNGEQSTPEPEVVGDLAMPKERTDEEALENVGRGSDDGLDIPENLRRTVAA